MGTLFGFVVGYVVGARAGSDGFDEVVASVRAIRESEEFVAFRSLLADHARSVAAQVGARLAGTAPIGGGGPSNGAGRSAADLLRETRERIQRG